MPLTFHKSERLHHRSLQERLFREGESLYDFPLRMVWHKWSDADLRENFRDAVPQGIAPLQVMVSIPKKRRRHAVDRVRMRRLIKEVWRLNKNPLREAIETNPQLRTISVGFIYIANENLPYEKIERKVNRLLARLQEKIK